MLLVCSKTCPWKINPSTTISKAAVDVIHTFLFWNRITSTYIITAIARIIHFNSMETSLFLKYIKKTFCLEILIISYLQAKGLVSPFLKPQNQIQGQVEPVVDSVEVTTPLLECTLSIIRGWEKSKGEFVMGRRKKI